jgi:hypothetical protein
MNITVDVRGLDKLAGLDKKIVDAALGAGLDAEAGVIERQMTKQVGNSYKGATKYSYIDSKGHKVTVEWDRSGNLQRGVTVTPGDGERTIGITGEAAKPITNYPGGYAQKLTTQPVSKDGKDRSNNFPQRTEEITRPQRGKACEQAIRNALGSIVS